MHNEEIFKSCYGFMHIPDDGSGILEDYKNNYIFKELEDGRVLFPFKKEPLYKTEPILPSYVYELYKLNII